MKVLIAEDEAVSRHVLQALLVKWGYDVVVTHNGAEAWQALQAEPAPRLAILDWVMPEMDGAEVCKKVREHKTEPYTYLLLLTAKDQKQDIVDGIEAGADDFLSKPFNADELKARLRSATRILTLQESLMATSDTLRFQATHDSLTGLWNRAAILDALQRELHRAQRQDIQLALALVDLDHFKQINDTHGHLVGDAVLREAARRMLSCVRTYDWVGRYGGEEFLLIVPGCEAPAAMKQAERLRLEVGSKPFETPEGRIPVTLSVGVAASGKPCDTDTISLVRAADEALYRAKEKGRNRVELAEATRPVTSPPEAPVQQC